MRGLILFICVLTSLSFSLSLSDLRKMVEEGEYEEVEAHIENLMISEDVSEDLLVILAEAKTGMGKLEEAQSLINSVLSKNPSNSNALLALAEIKSLQEEYYEALKILKKLPDSPKKNFLLMSISLNSGDLISVRRFLLKIPSESSYSVLGDRLFESVAGFRFNFRAGAGYDTNPTVTPEGVPLAKTPSAFGTVAGGMSYEAKRLSANLNADYVLYQSVPDFNTLTLVGETSLHLGFISIPLNVEYISLGGNLFRAVGGIGGTIDLFGARTTVSVGYQDYYEVERKEENRDGPFAQLSALKSSASGNIRWSVSGVLRYDNSAGSNWKRVVFFPGIAGGYARGNFTFNLSLGAGYYYYMNRDSIFGKRRQDIYAVVSPSINYNMGRYFVELRADLSQNMSNIELYRYRREVATLSAGGVF